MLAKLLDRLRPTNEAAVGPENHTPDISRVIKLPSTPTANPGPRPEIKLVDPADLGDLAEQGVDSLSAQFEAWMKADLNQLYMAWKACAADQSRPDDFRALFTAAHNIRGVASSYGYPAVSRLCGSLCNLLTSSQGNPPADLLKLHIDACRAAHRQSSNGESSQDVSEALCEAIERKVATGLSS